MKSAEQRDSAAAAFDASYFAPLRGSWEWTRTLVSTNVFPLMQRGQDLCLATLVKMETSPRGYPFAESSGL
jgi:hypothetical protein